VNKIATQTMSTSNQQQRLGRRQPFGFLNANTLSSGTGKSGTDGSGTAASAGHHASDPIKNESKKKFYGVLTSIVSRGGASSGEQRGSKKKHERSGSGGSSSSSSSSSSPPEAREDALSMRKSPTKTEEEEASKALETTSPDAATLAAVVLPAQSSCTQRTAPTSSSLQHNEFATSDVAGIFRPRSPVDRAGDDSGFFDDEMEAMLELKPANPILDDSLDVEIEEGRRIDPSEPLATELEESASGQPLCWSNRLEEGDGGFKIHVDNSIEGEK